jgi:glycosyltransferase involved in cell wall biosynthesis
MVSVTASEPHHAVRLSIVTTGHNERGNVSTFLSEASSAIAALGVSGEILFIDDGSTDGTGAAVLEFTREHPEVPITLVTHAACQGISTATNELVALARGELVCFLPSDLESLPSRDVPLLYAAMDEQSDVVIGCRQGRADGKSFTSRVANLLIWWLFGVRVTDANWIKLVRREKLENLDFRSDWHRFMLPILVHRGCRVKDVATQWHPRPYGRSKFGLLRIPVSLIDMAVLKILMVFGRRPMHFFCAVSGVALALSGLLAAGALWAAESHPGLSLLGAAWSAAVLVAALLGPGLGLVVEVLMPLETRSPPRDRRGPP